MSWQGFSNRKFPRVDSEIAITITKEASAQSVNSQIKNIGIGGLCVITSSEFRIYDRLNLSFQLPICGSPIDCTGQVVWAVQTYVEDQPMYDIGVQFVSIKKQAKDAIESYVQKIGSLDRYVDKDINDDNDSKEEQLV